MTKKKVVKEIKGKITPVVRHKPRKPRAKVLPLPPPVIESPVDKIEGTLTPGISEPVICNGYTLTEYKEPKALSLWQRFLEFLKRF